jgi:hypothetical protein
MFKNGMVGKMLLERKRREDMRALALAMKIQSDEVQATYEFADFNDNIRPMMRVVSASGEVY